jgi:hypothetical protein
VVAKLFGAICACCYVVGVSCSREDFEPPRPAVISNCADKGASFRRLKARPRGALRFDVPQSGFSIRSGIRDMPHETVHVITLNDDAAGKLIISMNDFDFLEVERTYPTFSKSVGKRDVQDSMRQKFGTDRWGYLPSGERWRHVRFTTGDQAGYEPLAPKEAERLDEIIGSACLATEE